MPAPYPLNTAQILMPSRGALSRHDVLPLGSTVLLEGRGGERTQINRTTPKMASRPHRSFVEPRPQQHKEVLAMFGEIVSSDVVMFISL